MILGNILSGIISILIIYAGQIELACYLSSIMFGISMSLIYPLILSFSIEEGLSVEDTQTSNIIMAGVISEGILTMAVGWLMEAIHENMLFYSLSLFGVVMLFIRTFCMGLISQQVIFLKGNDLTQ